MAVFPRGDNFVAFRFEALREFVELGYAMTVHKAQGSEFDSIAIVLPEKPVAVLTRELHLHRRQPQQNVGRHRRRRIDAQRRRSPLASSDSPDSPIG